MSEIKKISDLTLEQIGNAKITYGLEVKEGKMGGSRKVTLELKSGEVITGKMKDLMAFAKELKRLNPNSTDLKAASTNISKALREGNQDVVNADLSGFKKVRLKAGQFFGNLLHASHEKIAKELEGADSSAQSQPLRNTPTDPTKKLLENLKEVLGNKDIMPIVKKVESEIKSHQAKNLNQTTMSNSLRNLHQYLRKQLPEGTQKFFKEENDPEQIRIALRFLLNKSPVLALAASQLIPQDKKATLEEELTAIHEGFLEAPSEKTGNFIINLQSKVENDPSHMQNIKQFELDNLLKSLDPSLSKDSIKYPKESIEALVPRALFLAEQDPEQIRFALRFLMDKSPTLALYAKDLIPGGFERTLAKEFQEIESWRPESIVNEQKEVTKARIGIADFGKGMTSILPDYVTPIQGKPLERLEWMKENPNEMKKVVFKENTLEQEAITPIQLVAGMIQVGIDGYIETEQKEKVNELSHAFLKELNQTNPALAWLILKEVSINNPAWKTTGNPFQKELEFAEKKLGLEKK